MKKVLPLAIGTFAFISIASLGHSPIGVNAAGNILYGDNVIPNATFSLGGGGVSEVKITGEAPRGWGDWSGFDEYFVKDPTNSTNVVLKYQAGGFPDCFGLISDITAGTEYTLGFDYYLTSTTNNIGFHFFDNGAWSHDGNIFFADDVAYYQTTITDKSSGWKHVDFKYTSVGVFDSMGLWANTASGAIYFDNFTCDSGDGVNHFVNGDFSNYMEDIYVPELAFSADVVEGWGDWGGYNQAFTLDPTESTNVALRFNKGKGGFPDCFNLLSGIEGGKTYTFEFDYFAPNGTNNIGFHFYDNGKWSHDGNIFFADDVAYYNTTITDGLRGWKHVTATYTSVAAFDSVGLWANTDAGDIYFDNFSIKEEGGNNLFACGDFTSIADKLPGGSLTEEPDSTGLYGNNAKLALGSVTIESNGYYGVLIEDLSNSDYELTVKTSDVNEGASLVAKFIKEGASIKAVTIDVTKVDVQRIASISGATAVEFHNAGTSSLKITELCLKTIAESAYDPEFDYYEDKNLVVNGDFEAFEAGTKLSQTQLEGAWGSVDNYDNPGRIVQLEDGNKVAAIGRFDETDTKTYSSMFLMTPDDLTIGDLVRFRYDVKTTLSASAESYTVADSSLVGGANVEYYLLDFRAGIPSMTSGAEKLHYGVKTQALENGFTRVEFSFEITSDKIQWNSLRWLLTPVAIGDIMYIDNVEIHLLSETPIANPVTRLSIEQGDQELFIGDEVQLSFVANPEDHDETTFTWSSSNENIATVSSTGLVTAVGEGSAQIFVTAENGVKASIVVTVAKKSDEQPTKKGCKGSLIATSAIISGLALAGVALVAFKKKEK